MCLRTCGTTRSSKLTLKRLDTENFKKITTKTMTEETEWLRRETELMCDLRRLQNENAMLRESLYCGRSEDMKRAAAAPTPSPPPPSPDADRMMNGDDKKRKWSDMD